MPFIEKDSNESQINQSEILEKRINRNEFLAHISKNCLNKRDYGVIGVILFAMIAAIFFRVNWHQEFLQWHVSRLSTTLGTLLYSAGVTLLGLNVLFLFYLIYLAFKYKEVNNIADDVLPHCTVIVPAYNEGKLVYDTLLSLTDSNYPINKLEILAIDDGSKDDTWQWLLKAKEVLGNRISIFQQPQNMGKRHALYRGFNVGKGEVFVTVDSDSVVDENTLRNLVSPFAVKNNCGAVAGNVKVLNKEKGLLPKMLNVSFTFSFEFVRSAQSALGSVFCTPGALAAYRRDAVLSCVDEWMNQSFMGKPSTIGEDRALTNMILKQGLNVYFQKNALVYTTIPEHYKNLYNMLIRWERSNVRESIMMGKFAFSAFRKGGKAGTRVIFLMDCLKLITAIPLFISLIVLICSHPLLFICSSLSGALIFSSVQMIFYAKKYNFAEALLAYVFNIYYMFTLCWVTPYSILTAGKSGWLTRELHQKEV